MISVVNIHMYPYVVSFSIYWDPWIMIFWMILPMIAINIRSNWIFGKWPQFRGPESRGCLQAKDRVNLISIHEDAPVLFQGGNSSAFLFHPLIITVKVDHKTTEMSLTLFSHTTPWNYPSKLPVKRQRNQHGEVVFRWCNVDGCLRPYHGLVTSSDLFGPAGYRCNRHGFTCCVKGCILTSLKKTVTITYQIQIPKLPRNNRELPSKTPQVCNDLLEYVICCNKSWTWLGTFLASCGIYFSTVAILSPYYPILSPCSPVFCRWLVASGFKLPWGRAVPADACGPQGRRCWKHHPRCEEMRSPSYNIDAALSIYGWWVICHVHHIHYIYLYPASQQNWWLDM